MITIYIWLFVILCVFATFGLGASVIAIHILVIEPIRDMAANYKRYKKFYIDEHRKLGIKVKEDE